MNQVRLIIAAVRHDGHEAIVTLRSNVEPDPKTGIPMAVHSCIATACDDCHADLLDLADKTGHTFPAAADVEILRTSLVSAIRDKDADAQRRREENKAWGGKDATGRRLTFDDRKTAHGEVKHTRPRRNRRRAVAGSA